MRRVVGRKLYASDDIEDVVQEALLDSWRLLGRLRDDEAFLPWAIRIAEIHTMRYLRGQSRHQTVVNLSTELEESELFSKAEEFLVDAPVTHCLSQLSPPLMKAILARISGYTAVEHAQETGISLSASERRMSRAVSQLQQCLVEGEKLGERDSTHSG